MRPQDVVVLLKIVALGGQHWYNKGLVNQLDISKSEVSESLNRSLVSGLLEEDKKTVRREALFQFLVHGLKHVFPVIPGRLQRGLPTAYSAPVLSGEFVVDNFYIWPAPELPNAVKGISISPLYATVPRACAEDVALYELLALADALRVVEWQSDVAELLRNKMFE